MRLHEFILLLLLPNRTNNNDFSGVIINKGNERFKEKRKEESTSSMNLSMETTDDLEMEDLLRMPDSSLEELDTDNEEVDASFLIDKSIKSDVDHVKDTFCQKRVGKLERNDLVFLTFQLSNQLQKKETEAAEIAGIMTGSRII